MGPQLRTSPGRAAGIALLAVLASVVGCGDDTVSDAGPAGATSTEPSSGAEAASAPAPDESAPPGTRDDATCAARDELVSSLDALTGVDVVAGGTDALDAALDDVRASLDEVRDTAREDLGDEVDDVQGALDGLEAAATELADQGAGSGTGAAVASGLGRVVTSSRAVLDELAARCGG